MNDKIAKEIQDEQNHGRQKYGSGPDDFSHDDRHDLRDWQDDRLLDVEEFEKDQP